MKFLRGKNKIKKKGEIKLLHKGKQKFYLDQNSLGHGSTEKNILLNGETLKKK